MLKLQCQQNLKPRTLFNRNRSVGLKNKDRSRIVKLYTCCPPSSETSAQKMEMGIGIDIASIDRITQLIDRYDRETLSLLFTLGEINRSQSARNPYQHFAVCFATKEAMGKALGTGLEGIDWHEIEAIVSDFQLTIKLYGKAKLQATKLGFTNWIASWSTCNDYVLVQVIAS
jgi:holo-[acyl-carrier protein] synthase